MTKIKLSLLGLFVLFLSITIFVACSKDNNTEAKNSVLRENFLKNKNYSTIKTDFNKLDKEDKIALWNEKLAQLLSQDLSDKHKTLIGKLKLELNKNSIDTKVISEISINLANSIPEEDFLKMFATLDDYKFTGTFTGTTKVSEEIMSALISLKFNYNSNTNLSAKSNITAMGTRLDCNCNWTCSWYGTSSTNCKPTQSGCGFLWAFNCENIV